MSGAEGFHIPLFVFLVIFSVFDKMLERCAGILLFAATIIIIIWRTKPK